MKRQKPYAKLRGRIREKFGTQECFAKAINLNNATLSLKLNEKTQWKREEILLACKKLDIAVDEISSDRKSVV